MPASAVSASSSSRLSACRCWPGPWRSSCCSESSFCPSATARPCPPISAATPRRWSSSMASRAASIRCACAQARPIVGMSPSGIDLSAHPGLQLVAIQEGETAGPLRRPLVAEGDHLLLRGDAETAAAFATQMHLAFRDEKAAGQGEETLFNRSSGLAEVVIPPRSGLIGQSVFPGMVTESGDLIVLAVQRAGAGDCSRQRNQGCRRHRAAGRRHDAVAGNMEGARRSSRRSRRSGRQFAGAGPPASRADGAGRTPGRHHSDRDGSASRHRRRAARSGRPARCRCDHPVGDHERRASPTAPSAGPPSSSSAR